MSLTQDEDLELAFQVLSDVLNVAVTGNVGGDVYTLRDIPTGQYAGSGNVWSLFRSALDEINGSQGLAELGLI